MNNNRDPPRKNPRFPPTSPIAQEKSHERNSSLCSKTKFLNAMSMDTPSPITSFNSYLSSYDVTLQG